MSNSLAAMRPKLVREWSEKNYPLLPTMVPTFANKFPKNTKLYKLMTTTK